MKTEILPFDPSGVKASAKLLMGGEVVALPTETVYGLAGNAFQNEAIEKIFKAKERPSFDPLIVHISERYLTHPHGLIPALVEDGILAPEILSASELSRIHQVMKLFWPGPLTFILPRGPKIPDAVTASQPTVGIRCPAHPAFQSVLSMFSFPLAAPSANRFGRISPTEAAHVVSELNGKIPAVLNGGACEVGVESTIIRIDFPFRVTLLRPGKISLDELTKAFQGPVHLGKTLGEANLHTVSPGSLDEHYAPTKPLYLFPHAFSEQKSLEIFLERNPLPNKLAIVSMKDAPKHFSIPNIKTCILSAENSLSEMAHLLFKTLRDLDADPEIEAILSDIPEDHSSGLGAAITDRLRRASQNKPEIA